MQDLIMMIGLYAAGIFIGFMSIPLFVTFKRIDEKEGIEFDEKYNHILLAFRFMEEVEEAPDSCLTEDELKDLSNKILHYEIPYLNQKVIFFYDHEKAAFCYYASSTLIYKYLNVVARKYVLDYECKQIYKEMLPSTRKEEKTVTFGNFVPKVGKTTLEKEMNRFLYLGNLHEYKPGLTETNKITFSEYMKQMRATLDSGLEPDSGESVSSNPDTQSTKLD
jgi:hypothetical protein